MDEHIVFSDRFNHCVEQVSKYKENLERLVPEYESLLGKNGGREDPDTYFVISLFSADLRFYLDILYSQALKEDQNIAATTSIEDLVNRANSILHRAESICNL